MTVKRTFPKHPPDRGELFTRSGGIQARFFGTRPQALGAQSGLAWVRWDGTNAGATNYVVSRTANATANGLRWFSTDNANQPLLAVGFDSTGTAGAPNVTNTTVVHKYGLWYCIAYSHDGSLTAANITMYSNSGGTSPAGSGGPRPLVAIANSTTTNGTTAFSNSAANKFAIGDRDGGARNWVGAIGFVAQWNRVLALQELEQARIYGPLSTTNGLVLLWANGYDYGPQDLTPIQAWSDVPVQLPPYVRLAPASQRMRAVYNLAPKIIGTVSTGTWKTNTGLLVSSQIKTRAGTAITSIKTSNGLTR